MLSGTPALSKPKELFNLLKIIRPDKFLDFKPFGVRFCDPSVVSYGRGTHLEYNGSTNRNELHFVLSTVMIRRLKKEVLSELPQKNRMKREIETDSKILKEITDIKKQFSGGEDDFDNIIGEMI